MPAPNLRTELFFLFLLALLWGSSYLFIKIAVSEIPPITLIAMRVAGATIFLLVVMGFRSESLPRDTRTWKMLFIQSIFNSIAAWTILAWGQQHIDSGLASVLNSTSPIFTFLLTAFIVRHESLGVHKFIGAILGIFGIILIVGIDALGHLGDQFFGQLACLFVAFLYAIASIYGKRFSHISALATATGTLIWATIILVPASLIIDSPWTLTPSFSSLAATFILSIFCTGVALLIYFRLLGTLGSLGTTSQSYLRGCVGVFLGIVFLGETITLPTFFGLALALLGVFLINWRRS